MSDTALDLRCDCEATGAAFTNPRSFVIYHATFDVGPILDTHCWQPATQEDGRCDWCRADHPGPEGPYEREAPEPAP